MNDLIDKDYISDLNRIKETIKQNQSKALVYVNSQMILTYYEIGTIINKRKTWGSKYIQKLSEDLKEYGRGFSYEQLKKMSRFANEFSFNEIRLQPATQIPWFTIVRIMSKSKSHEEMLWYINETHKNNWSRNQVLKQFELKAYERSLIEPTTSPVVKTNNSLNNLFKDSYVFDFINKDAIKHEKDLKNALLNNVIEFLHELGKGFALVDKEYKLVTPSNKAYFIDLLLYNYKIHAFVVIELKIGEFHPSYLGQLAFYVNAINKMEKSNVDNDTIGLLLCKDSDSFTVKTTLDTINVNVSVSNYEYANELKNYLIEKLNKKKALH